MPLLDSFLVDHTRMAAPAVRVAKTMTTLVVIPSLFSICVFVFLMKRFCRKEERIHWNTCLPVLCVTI